MDGWLYCGLLLNQSSIRVLAICGIPSAQQPGITHNLIGQKITVYPLENAQAVMAY